MLIGKVKTITLEWWSNVLLGMTKGTAEFDYWTSGWIPDRDIDRIEVYYEGDRVLSGEVINCYKNTPDKVYNHYKNTPDSIGLNFRNNTLNDFKDLLKKPFKKTPEEIGNIIFKVDYVSKKTLQAILSKKSDDLNIEIGELETKSEDRKKLQSRIVYEEI